MPSAKALWPGVRPRFEIMRAVKAALDPNDVAICIGVGLMAVDMLGTRREPHAAAPTSSGAS